MPDIDLEIEYEDEGDFVQSSVDENKKNQESENSYATPLNAAFGIVQSRDSSLNFVDVELESGMYLKSVEVISREWAGYNLITGGFGERDLPPVGCKVLVIFPEGIIENAFVLCSVLSVLGAVGIAQEVAGLHGTGKENERLRITEAGLKETHDKTVGSYKLEDKFGNTIEMNATGIILNGNLLVTQ